MDRDTCDANMDLGAEQYLRMSDLDLFQFARGHGCQPMKASAKTGERVEAAFLEVARAMVARATMGASPET